MKDDNSLEGMLSEVLHLITGNKILDVGTGFGIVVSKLMERSDTQIYSVDPEAWSFASLHSAYEGHIKTGRLSLVESRVEDLDLGDDVFDTSIAIASLHHLGDPVLGIKKMEKLTRGIEKSKSNSIPQVFYLLSGHVLEYVPQCYAVYFPEGIRQDRLLLYQLQSAIH